MIILRAGYHMSILFEYQLKYVGRIRRQKQNILSLQHLYFCHLNNMCLSLFYLGNVFLKTTLSLFEVRRLTCAI